MRKVGLFCLVGILGLAFLLGALSQAQQTDEGWKAYPTKKFAAQPIKKMPFDTPTTVSIVQDDRLKKTRSYVSTFFEGVSLYVVDDDENGSFNDKVADAVAVGNSKYAVPLGSILSVNGKIWELRTESDGSKVELKPYTGELGKIDFTSEFKAPGKVNWLVVQDQDKNFIDVSGPGAHEIPCGEYIIGAGMVTMKRETAMVRAGEMEKIKVTKDEVAKPKWGPPITLDFTYTIEDKKGESVVNIQLSSIRYIGSAKEEYYNFQPEAIPKVFVRDGGGKELMKRIWDTG